MNARRASRALLLTLAAALAAAPAVARADEAADHHAAAASLLEQLHPENAVNAMMPNIINGLRMNLTHGDPDLVKGFNDVAPALAAEGEAAKPDLMERLAEVYAKTFTTEELKAIEAFYQTPAGAKMIATQGQVTADTIGVVRDWGTTLARKMAEEARAKLQSRQP